MFNRQAGIKCCVTILALMTLVSPARSQGPGPQGAGPQGAGPRGPTAAQVDRSIDAAVRYLLGAQLNDGGWPEFSKDFPHGVSCLVSLSLLNAGLEPDSPVMTRALRHLSEYELEKVYTVSLQTMVFCLANPNQYAVQIKRNVLWLIEAQQNHGGWSYDRSRGGGDPSNSQFALLALHEAQRAGVDLPRGEWQKVFERARGYWYNLQNGDGSFSYSGSRGSGGMTCAGIASLIIVGSQLESLEASAADNIQCCGGERNNDDRIQAALNWLGRVFSVRSNPGENSHHLYYMYALERAGRMTGQRFIGDHDWYREGVDQLISICQDPQTGKIIPSGRAYLGTEHTETAFALLFLAKGKRQIVISRLKTPRGNDWNHHSSAIQNLTAHTEQAWKRDLAWQTIDLQRARLEDLLESPVLFISGSRSPRFRREEKALLKEYVEQGGFIFAEACNGDGCDGTEFEEYFRRLVVELFEQPLEKIAPEHPIWFAEARVNPSELPENMWLYGVQTCCRLGVVYSPISLSCRWELNLPYGNKPDFNDQVQQDLDNATKIGINVLSYATGKELKQKLDAVTILDDVVKETSTDRGLFILPVLKHNAGSDDAPRAVPNLIGWLDKENPFQLSSEKRLISIVPEELQNYPVVFMHGRGELRFTEAQRSALRDYLKNGGFLFANAICADEQFARSFQQEMEIILEERLEPLPATHPLLTDKYYGFDVRSVEIISPDRSGEKIISITRKSAPDLRTGTVDGRIAVVFSPLDLSCALESRHSLQCRGYIRQDAARIGINVILYALQQ